jgi:ABC-2 type transport system ATP-binding protein
MPASANVPGKLDLGRTSVVVEGLCKDFGSFRALEGVTFDVRAGESLVILGENGAGKTTTLRCLAGVLLPSAGSVRLGGVSVAEDAEAVRAQVGLLSEVPGLYERMTAPEYLDFFGRIQGMGQRLRQERIGELLHRFGLDMRTGVWMGSFSKGMRQKVALIRATLHEPSWLFCDEPTVGLDPVAAADMRRYLGEQRDRGAAVIVTTHVLVEAELLADRVAIMRRGRVVADGTLAGLRRWAYPTRRFTAVLSADLEDPQAILEWLREHEAMPELEGRRLSYGVPWEWPDAELAEFAAELQRRLHRGHAPYFELSEQQQSLEKVYLKAMAEAADPPARASRPANIPGLRPGKVLGSLREQPRRLAQFLPFYVSSWWRRGDLSWVMYLNAFVLLLVGGVSLFGSAPGNLGSLAGRIPRGASLEAGLLLPLFFMSFALLESIKSSIGIWWEKAQQSLEVLLYTPLDDPSLIWLEVLPGVVVSAVYVTFWVAAGMALMTIFGRPAPCCPLSLSSRSRPPTGRRWGGSSASCSFPARERRAAPGPSCSPRSRRRSPTCRWHSSCSAPRLRSSRCSCRSAPAWR